MSTLADRLRVLLDDYDDTMATPLQAQDIAETDLRDAVIALMEEYQS